MSVLRRSSWLSPGVVAVSQVFASGVVKQDEFSEVWPYDTGRHQSVNARDTNVASEMPYLVLPTKAIPDEQRAVLAYEIREHFTHCGGSQYELLTDGRILEFKGVNFRHTHTYQLSEVDRVNGYEWKGLVLVEYKMAGGYSNGWSEWSAPERGDIVSEVIYKQHGQWHVPGNSADYWTPNAIACSNIPPG